MPEPVPLPRLGEPPMMRGAFYSLIVAYDGVRFAEDWARSAEIGFTWAPVFGLEVSQMAPLCGGLIAGGRARRLKSEWGYGELDPARPGVAT